MDGRGQPPLTVHTLCRRRGYRKVFDSCVDDVHISLSEIPSFNSLSCNSLCARPMHPASAAHQSERRKGRRRQIKKRRRKKPSPIPILISVCRREKSHYIHIPFKLHPCHSDGIEYHTRHPQELPHSQDWCMYMCICICGMLSHAFLSLDTLNQLVSMSR